MLKNSNHEIAGTKPSMSWSSASFKWRAVSFCCTGRQLTPPRSYLALCSMEPGLSSPNILAATAQLALAQCT